jgi:phosphoribosyl 1,2-cyclic phosphodiesterase
VRLISLQSGSNGNCLYVEAGGRKLLFDAGISGKQAEGRLTQAGADIRSVDALFISHDHRDHVASLGIFQRKFGLRAVVSSKTLDAASRRCKLGALGEVEQFTPGKPILLGNVTIETIPTPHDGVDGCGFIVDDSQKRLGILTDLGHVFNGLADVLATLDGVLIESNYDETMLRRGHYPAFLKRRIAGAGGHLSNTDAGELIRAARNLGRLQWACLGHLSQDNNRPELALATARQIAGEDLPIHLAGRYSASAAMEL